MKTTIRRRFLAVCLMLMMFVTTVPVSYADGTSGTSVSEIMQKFDSRVQAPKS